MKKIITFIFILFAQGVKSQNMVTYAGGSGREVFYDVVQLSNGKFLVAGSAENLNWINAAVPRTILTGSTTANANGGGDYGFLLLLDSNRTAIEQVVHLPLGAAENVRFIKSTNLPLAVTGDLFISGQTEDSRPNGGGFFIGKLNNNFVNGIPTGFSYLYNNWAEGEVKVNQPWDVNALGEVTMVQGQAHANDWAIVHKLNAAGQRMVVPNWRRHWTASSEVTGVASAYAGNQADLLYSGIVLKLTGRCDLRSQNTSDFMAMSADGNGGMKRGTWPFDIFFNSPCDNLNVTTTGPGYTGYNRGGSPVIGGLSVAIDRRNGDVFFGLNSKSVLPGGLPDFEPAVMKMNATGTLQWWSRLYHEIQPSGDTVNSTPDQYVDGIAIDYSTSGVNAQVVVLGRTHGNNVENFWEGNNILATPGATGFQNQFTGTNGNIHLSWIGKLKSSDGTLMKSTYLGEMNEGYSGGTPFASGLTQGWPNPNTGWASLNTTRMSRNAIKVTADGSILVMGVGRRTITTTNAYQQNLLPSSGLTGSWNAFVRVYTPDLSSLSYSSMIVGTWDAAGVGGDNARLHNAFKTRKGIVVVGDHLESGTTGVASGTNIPTTNVPAWGSATPSNRTAIFAYLEATTLINPNDNPVSGTSVVVCPSGTVINVTGTVNNTLSTIDATVNGGTDPYTYLWSNGVATQDITTAVVNGIYSLTVTDVNGCTNSTNFTVNNTTLVCPPGTVITIVGSVDNSASNIDVTYVTGGTAPYTYLWSNGITTQDIVTAVANGSYTVTVRDANGCSNTATYSVNNVSTQSLEQIAGVNSLTIYPNPSTSDFNVSLNLKEISRVKVELVTFQGQVLETQNAETLLHSFKFKTSSYERGSYILRTTVNNNSISRLIVIQ